jgi:hypothetical protein
VRLFDAGFHADRLCSESEFFFSPLIPLAFPAAVLKHDAHRAPKFPPQFLLFCAQPKLGQAASEIVASGRSVPLRTFAEILTSFSCSPIYV